jgi:hypothetical protein
VTGYGLDKRGSTHGRDFLFSTVFRPFWGSTHPSIKSISRVKLPECEDDCVPPSSSENNKYAELYLSSVT